MLDKNSPKQKQTEKRSGAGRLKMPTDVAFKLEQGKQEVTGAYVFLPQRMADPSKSGLTYTVKAGAQTHDGELSDAAAPKS